VKQILLIQHVAYHAGEELPLRQREKLVVCLPQGHQRTPPSSFSLRHTLRIFKSSFSIGHEWTMSTMTSSARSFSKILILSGISLARTLDREDQKK
jgi:hypothetical protein